MSRYKAIENHIKNDIESGSLGPGRKVPSIRSYADKFGVCNATVIHAFKNLENEHILYSVSKSGYYVVVPKEADSLCADSNAADFSTATPGSELLPYPDFKSCINQAIDFYRESLFTYSDQQGFEGLRKTLAKYFQQNQIFTGKDNIVITSGSYQGLYLLAGMPFPNGNTDILVEQPTLNCFLRILNKEKIRAVGIERSSGGIDLDRFESIIKGGNIKFFYTMPRFQNPTGFSYSALQKKEIARLAEKYNVYIVEDDFLADLEPDTKSDPIFAYGSAANIIYLRSFSKTLLPGIRIGAVVLPKLLINEFLKQKRILDIGNYTMNQAALQLYINCGMLDRHNRDVKKLYMEKMGVMKRVWDSIEDKDVTLHIPVTGFFAWLEVPDYLSSTRLAFELKNHGIYAAETEGMYLPCFYTDQHLRLSVCRVDRSTIEQKLPVIAQCAKKIGRMPGNAPASEYIF